MTEPIAATCTLVVGALVRGATRRALKQAAWARSLDITIEEDRGLLDSVMRVRVTGAGADLREYAEMMNKSLAEWNSDEQNDA